MIEVCFNDSLKANLMQTKTIYKNSGIKKCLGLSFFLAYGDISAEINEKNALRKEIINDLFQFERYGENSGFYDAADEFWRSLIDDLDELINTRDNIRIWVDNTPDALCGLYFVSHILKDRDNDISIIEYSDFAENNDGDFSELRGFEDFNANMLLNALQFERPLNGEDIAKYAKNWENLKKENAPLRAILNNEVVSTNIDFYDEKIRAEFDSEGDFIAKIIGRAMFLQKVPTNDVFIAKRIRHFISNSKLSVIDNEDAGFYEMIVMPV